MKTICCNKDGHLLQDMRNFIGLFRDATLREQRGFHNNFRSGLLRLRNGFDTIYKQEKPYKVEKFRIVFSRLISTVQQMQENGLWRKTYFNLFTTLGYQRLEDVHSNILAWLLNPEESHGLGDAFLRDFVRQVFDKELPKYFSVNVKRESQDGDDRPDIVVEGNNWWLIIENKIDSIEQENQTKRYADRWRKKGINGENVFLAFLSPSGWLPESLDFKPVSYRTIRELLEKQKFQGDSNFMIRHFKDHILFDFGG